MISYGIDNRKGTNMSTKDAANIIRDLGIEDTKDPARHRTYSPTTRGKNTQLGICSFWATLFLANEGLRKSEKMTDAEIKRQVLAEFPKDEQPPRTQESLRKLDEGEVTVNYYRGLYNKGRLTGKKIPKHLSKRYGNIGEVINGRTGKAL